MRIRDLGLLMVEVDGAEQPLPGRRPQAILARLLLDVNHRVSAAEIIDAVWGDDTTDRTSTLESHIWRLRRVLEPGRAAHQPAQVLVTDTEGYRLLARTEDVDSLLVERQAGEIRELVAAGDPDRILQRCDEALALWRGRPFEPLSDELWAAPAVARLVEVRSGIAASRIDALLDLGQHQQVIADLEPLLAEAPLHERFWAQRMLALHRAGRTDQALEAYRRVRRLLDDELGLEPGVELEQMQRRILEQDPDLVAVPAAAPRGAAPVPRVSLPPRGTLLVGRAGDVGQIGRLVARSRLVSITGVAGCGKTRLAVEVAHAMTSAFPDGVCFVDLATIDDSAQVTELVASTLRIAPTVVGTARDTTVEYLKRRQVLLVLDNCEHVLSGVAELVDELSDSDAECSALLTSREAVGFPGEVIWTLGPLPVEATSPEEQSPAAELLLARLAEVVPSLEVDDTIRAQADEICAAVDGLPLAIELAAARVRTDGIGAVVAQVALDPARLRRLGQARGGHHHSLGEAIDWSYRLLSEDERLLHRRLSVLPGPFTADVAAALTARSGDSGSPGPDADAVQDLLAFLAHRSLLATVPSATVAGGPRYRQLATVRAHARRALVVDGEAADAAGALDTWVRDLIARRPRTFGVDRSGWYDLVDDNYDAVRGSLHHLLIEDPHPSGVAVVTGLTGYWYLRRRLIEGLSWLEAASAVRAADPVDAAEVQCALAVRLVLQGRLDLALAHVEKAQAGLALPVPAERLVNLAWALAGLAYALLTGSERDLVHALNVEVRGVAEATGDADLALVADALSATATFPPDTGEIQAVYASAVEGDNTFAALICTSFFSLYALFVSDHDLGRLWVERGRELHQQIGGRAFSGFDENRADFAAMAGDYAAAATLYGASSSAAYRDGTVWPRQGPSRELLQRTEKALTREEFLEAWRAGEESLEA
ncbi:AfsR/SARP family transcriptional regulator [Nocardioides sp.]|uniref:AfsR/SARP family transcriptional regulator n=1 Tax=Nocardioides sp. TaxID=35761 RepID=UPI003D0B7C25